MKKVYLGLGTDLGNRLENLKNVIDKLNNSTGNVTITSPVYETEPVGFKGKGDFLNMVVLIETTLTPDGILEELMKIESGLGRRRGEIKNVSRIIDIDILLYDSEVHDRLGLIIPHPRMQERKFVLVPLNDIAPDLIHPVFGKTIAELLSECSDNSHIRPFTSSIT